MPEMHEVGTSSALETSEKNAEVHDLPSASISPASSGEELLSARHAHGAETTFDTGDLTDFYKPVDTYEGAHRYDPNFEWTAAEERRIVRKLDLRICSWVCFAFFALQLDRSNITQAVSDTLLHDLKMNTNDYNTGQQIFYASFLVAELPSQMISKRLGPDRWIPIQMVIWSLIASMQAFMSSRSSYFACRALLGIWEGGFIPDNVLYLSYFYKSNELPVRLSMFWTSYQATYIVGAFFAFGILHMAGVNGLAGWRWLFALEGTLTGVIGIATYFYLPPSPTQTASWFRGKNGWFSEREEKIMVNRVLRDDPSKGDMHNRQAVDFGMFKQCLCDTHMWPIYFLGVCWLLPSYPSQQYITLLLKSDGFDTFHTNLLTIPAYCLFIINLLFWTRMTEWLNDRFLLTCVYQLWCLVPLVVLEVLPAGNANNLRWGRYACTIIIAGSPYFHAVLVAITSRNAGSVRTRTVASAIYNMCVQTGNIIGSQIYRDDDKPLYRRGNKVLLAFCGFNICALVCTKVFYMHINAKRARVWDRMTREEKEHYVATTKDQGSRRLDFRFSH